MSWIAVGLSADLPKSVVMPACVSGTEMAIWRAASGVCRAWADRCPHRGMRLSHGFVRGETLACIYHGWRYGSDGTCSHIPAHPRLEPPGTIRTTGYPCSERGGLIWVSLSDAKDEPPETGGRVAVRSLPVERSAAQVASSLGQELAPVLVIGGPQDLALAIQPVTDHACMVHVLAAADADRKAASRKCEAMRAELEGVAA